MSPEQHFKMLAFGDSTLAGEPLAEQISPEELGDILQQGLEQVLGDLAAASLWPLASYHQDNGAGFDPSSLNAEYVIPIAAYRDGCKAGKGVYWDRNWYINSDRPQGPKHLSLIHI